MKRGSMIVLAAVLLLLTGCGANLPAKQPMPPESGITSSKENTSSSQATIPDVKYDGIGIETPCGTIYYPLQWEELLKVETASGDPMVITFLTQMEGKAPQPLFDLLFGTAIDAPVGRVRTEDGQELLVGTKIHDFQPDSSWTQNQIDAVYGMQEALNTLMEQLPFEDVEEQQPSKPADAEDLIIETAYCKLHYPAKWEKYLLVKTLEDGAVEFRAVLPGRKEQLLFTVCFGGETGHMSQTIDGAVTVNIFIAETTFEDGWTEAEKDIIYSMQEDLNHLFDTLQGGLTEDRR